MGNLSTRLAGIGRLEDAEDLGWQSLEAHQRVLGPEHPNTLGVICNLSTVLSQLGLDSAAVDMLWPALEAQLRVGGAEHRTTLAIMANLCTCLARVGRHGEASELKVQAEQLGSIAAHMFD